MLEYFVRSSSMRTYMLISLVYRIYVPCRLNTKSTIFCSFFLFQPIKWYRNAKKSYLMLISFYYSPCSSYWTVNTETIKWMIESTEKRQWTQYIRLNSRVTKKIHFKQKVFCRLFLLFSFFSSVRYLIPMFFCPCTRHVLSWMELLILSFINTYYKVEC